MRNPAKRLRKQIFTSIIVLFSLMSIISMIAGIKLFAQEKRLSEGNVEEETAVKTQLSPEFADISKFAFISAAVAFGLGAVGAGVAIGNVGAAAMGAVAEKPEVAGQALIFVALAEGLVVFGFITALMILGKV